MDIGLDLYKKLKDLQYSITTIKKTICDTESNIQELKLSIANRKSFIEKTESEIYITEQKILHVNEILRLAKIHLPRLRGSSDNELIPKDITELKKWLDRTKSMDGYINIINAFKRIENYRPGDIKNIYAFIQKIIIEGPRK